MSLETRYGVVTETGTQIFSMKTPYLKQGITTAWFAKTDLLTLATKVYAEGGENLMHYHLSDDHSFMVIEGEATFYLETEDNAFVLGPFEGVMIPKRASYRFQNTGEGNLVMIRAAAKDPTMAQGGFYADGTEKDFKHEPYIGLERIEAPGPGFGDRT